MFSYYWFFSFFLFVCSMMTASREKLSLVCKRWTSCVSVYRYCITRPWHNYGSPLLLFSVVFSKSEKWFLLFYGCCLGGSRGSLWFSFDSHWLSASCWTHGSNWETWKSYCTHYQTWSSLSKSHYGTSLNSKRTCANKEIFFSVFDPLHWFRRRFERKKVLKRSVVNSKTLE